MYRIVATVGIAAVLALGPLPAHAQAPSAPPSDAQAAKPTAIMQIQVIDPKGNPGLYLSLVKKTIARQHVVSPGIRTRLFQGTFAGAATGQIYLVLEYPSLAFMVEAQARLARDPEWDRLQRETGANSGRTLISNSLFVEVTP